MGLDWVKNKSKLSSSKLGLLTFASCGCTNPAMTCSFVYVYRHVASTRCTALALRMRCRSNKIQTVQCVSSCWRSSLDIFLEIGK